MKTHRKSTRSNNHPARLLQRAHKHVKRHTAPAARLFEDLLTSGVLGSLLHDEEALQHRPAH